MPQGRVELPRPLGHTGLNGARLPFRHRGSCTTRGSNSAEATCEIAIVSRRTVVRHRAGVNRTRDFLYPKQAEYHFPTARKSGWWVPPPRPRAPRARALLAELHPDVRVVARRSGALLRGVRHVPCSSVISRAAAVVMASSRCATCATGLSSFVALTRSLRPESNRHWPRMGRLLDHRGSQRWEREPELNRQLWLMRPTRYHSSIPHALGANRTRIPGFGGQCPIRWTTRASPTCTAGAPVDFSTHAVSQQTFRRLLVTRTRRESNSHSVVRSHVPYPLDDECRRSELESNQRTAA